MKTGMKIGLIVGGIMFLFMLVLMIGILGFTYYTMSKGTDKAREDYRKQTAATVGTITNVSLSTSNKEYTYKFEVNGVTYTGTTTSGRSKGDPRDYRERVGKKATVCYDPNDPNNSDFKLLEVLQPDGEKSKCFGS